jgi:hypothetical protein
MMLLTYFMVLYICEHIFSAAMRSDLRLEADALLAEVIAQNRTIVHVDLPKRSASLSKK